MLISAMKRKPKDIGVARINFSEITRPQLDNNVISLPVNGRNSYFKIRGKDQFLYVVHLAVNYLRVTSSGNLFYWAGVDDGQVFLTPITPEAFRAFYSGGKKKFFYFVKPKVIKELEKQNPGLVSKRQGDIWACRIPGFAWGLVNIMGHVLNLLGDIRDVKKRKVFDTRHTLTGRLCQTEAIKDWNIVILFSGILTSPDHEPLDLTDGIYVLAQNNGLMNSGGD